MTDVALGLAVLALVVEAALVAVAVVAIGNMRKMFRPGVKKTAANGRDRVAAR